MSAYFVTSTGTDIGKTFVTAGLIRHLRGAGKNVSALKPIVSGFDVATSALSDPAVLLAALDEPVTQEALLRLSPWQFAAPLSPDMAAAREERSIDFEELVALCQSAVAAAGKGTLFIEGVGGIMVPLSARYTVLDWTRALNIPLIVVAGSYLGTISHTLTALEVAARAKLKVAALVVNDSGDGAVPLDETVSTLRRFVGVPIVTIPRVKAPVAARAEFARLAALL
ncbi:MAG TPA: dethiobiotin synthase [Rhizomicrobium sp.]|jgi:dethiobiotin synthetase|nr:dethiobiotin synthase [Rhizomicrobium sp.]